MYIVHVRVRARAHHNVHVRVRAHVQYMDEFEFKALPCFISVCDVSQEPDGVSIVPGTG